MKSGKNELFVANRTDIETAWIFDITSDSESSANIEEATNLISNLFDAFDRFVRPTSAEYILWVSEPDSKEDVPVTGEIESTDGITSSEVATQFRRHSENGTFRRLTISENTTRIELEDGEHWIDASSDQYRIWTGEIALDQQPAEDLFRIDIFYNDGSDNESNYYQIAIWTYTDIWFEDTEIGSQNRERLETLLNRLYKAIDANNVELDSRFVSEHSLKEQGFKGLLPNQLG